MMPDPPPNLKAVREHQPLKFNAILDHMRDLTQKFVDKGLLEFSFTHQLIWEYAVEMEHEIDGQPSSRMTDLLELLSDHVTKLLTTKSGARLVCLMSTFGTAKDRKRMLKPLKGNALESFCHPCAHLGLMRLLDVTDDTVTVQKCILEELRAISPVEKYNASGELIGVPLPPLVTIAMNRYGRKMLVRLLTPHIRNLEPDEEELFGRNSSTSKKTPLMRRTEHLLYLKSALITTLSKYAVVLARDKSGCQVLYSTVLAFCPGNILQTLALVFTGQPVVNDDGVVITKEDRDEANDDQFESTRILKDNPVKRVSKAQSKLASLPSNENQPELSIEEDSTAHWLLKQLIQLQSSFENIRRDIAEKDGTVIHMVVGRSSTVQIDETLWESDMSTFSFHFCSTLLEKVREYDLIQDWMTRNRPCFILAELLKVPSISSELKILLSKIPAKIRRESQKHPGGVLLAQLMSAKS
jgi:hypothetical protein